ncbi:MAG: hypothetical protein Q9214_005813, partial [Letrouitia sp. 1 TL-2023]
FQSELTGNGNRFHGDEPSSAERQSNADIKLTIYEKAIKNVQTLKDKEVLLQGMMRAGATVWEANKLSMKWQNVLRQYPKSVQLKIDYLGYVETTSSLVSVEEICKVYYDCLDLLDECRTLNGADEGDLYVKQVYVTLRMTLFLRKAGFLEHAVAIWQALLEYEFYMPANLEVSRCKIPKDSKLDLRSAFEDFWDSELPRIGEPDAQGWSNFQADHDVSIDPRKDIIPMSLGSLNQFEAWGQTERSHSLNSHYPARTIDDVNKNDPYRVILFPDIKNFLIRSPTDTGRWVLVDALFCFCHLPPYLSRTFDDGPSLWFGDPFIRNEILYGDQRSILRWPEGKSKNSETDDDLKERSSCSPFTLPVQDYLLTTDTLFTAKENWFSAFNAWNTKTQGGIEPVNGFWIYRVMAMLLHTAKLGERFVEYYLAFELEINPEVARKTAKALLKAQPSNLRLYNAYALVEYRLENVGTADRVIQKASEMRNKLDKDEVCNMISLCRTRTWQRLESSQSLDALQGIVEFSIGPVEDAAPSTMTREYGTHDYESTTTTLKAQTNLIAIRNDMLSLKLPFHAIECVECLILLAYLGNSHSTALATDTFKRNLLVLVTRFPLDSSVEELIRQSFARILYWHATHKKLFSPAALRAFLTESIESFPRNSMFLSLYAWNETRFRIDDRVRSIISGIILRSVRSAPTDNAESIVTHVFAIWANIQRETSLGSNHQAVRETFERAFRSECGAKCSGLWKIYFLFEYSRGETRRAKDVFYRGVTACPWVKELYWLAFEYLKTEMTDLELRNVYDMMVDREIRIHVALEDVAVKT